MTDNAVLTVGDQRIELPVIEGAEGELSVDISSLRSQAGLTTYDPGLVNTSICKSAITYIDGAKGILRYRGIPVEQFTAQPRPNFVEVAWLLIFGRLPTADELKMFRDQLTSHELLHEDVKDQFQPGVVSGLSEEHRWDDHSQFVGDEQFPDQTNQDQSKGA